MDGSRPAAPDREVASKRWLMPCHAGLQMRISPGDDTKYVIEALPADGSNLALDKGCLPGRSSCGKHLLDPHVLQLPSNILAIDTISIPEYLLRHGVIRKGLKKLLRGPFCGWMRRDVEVNDAARALARVVGSATCSSAEFLYPTRRRNCGNDRPPARCAAIPRGPGTPGRSGRCPGPPGADRPLQQS